MSKIISHANAKVNLTLKITGKRTDGYHDLESIFLFLPDVYDTLIFNTNEEFSEKSGVIQGVPDEINSIKKAARLLKNHFELPIPHVKVIKKIPTEAGLGGGSSDSACFINSVFDIWQLSLSEKSNFIKHANILGADAIVFLHKYISDKTALLLLGTGFEGTTHDIDLSHLRGKYILLVNNGTKLSTKTVFSGYRGQTGENSLTEVAIELEPSILAILSDLQSTAPMLCRMSGSGSTCFGIYDTKQKAEKHLKSLGDKYCFVAMSRIS